MAFIASAVLSLTAACSRNSDDSATSHLTDRDQIAGLVTLLGASLDERDFDRLRMICSEDVTVHTPGGQSAGPTAVIAQAEKIHSRRQRTQHVLSDIIVDVTQDRAKIRANSVATFVPTDVDTTPPEPLFRIGEVYTLEAKLTDQGWRLSRIASAPVWLQGALPPGMAGN
ncbi:nuclear transport factor 2 family protein [Nocardia blacklockiae]|uniref:nuclear transport factor 2 family protein n=1 Tax=Nocardia blacklockiae TaxID=480036 RepID=UPI0018932CD0|nr:nuclear transport factor 2 family protein [Nocardia blacklockiae]MBF6176381.1 nuclear transport factor 2 family protein [Nocardia blacklockiae]